MNICVFIGRLVNDPELKQVNDTHVVRFRLAVPKRYRNKTEGWKTQTSFVNMEAWDSAAELIARDFRKGDVIYIRDSSAESKSWIAEDGSKRYRDYFRINEFNYPIASGPSSSHNTPDEGLPQRAPSAPQKASSAPLAVYEEEEVDDIPF